MELLETILHSFVNLAMLLFEYIGVGVITYAGIQGIVNYVRRSPDTRLMLAKGLAMGLEFKLGSEILRTVVVRNLQEIGIVAGIIALRATLTILIHWEIKNEENEERMHEHAEEAPVRESPAVTVAEASTAAAPVTSTAQSEKNSDGATEKFTTPAAAAEATSAADSSTTSDQQV